MKNKTCLLLALAVTVLISCRKNAEPYPTDTVLSLQADSVSGVRVARSIIQDIVIKNNNPDDLWAEQCLQGMYRDTLVSVLFDMAYSGQAKVYDFDTDALLNVKDLKKRENMPGFSRDKVGKVQFVESWYLDPAMASFTKKVSSLVIGYETFDSQGQFIGYLPVFRMVLH